VLVAAVFLGPLLVALWLYYSGSILQPEGRVNRGALLEPIVNLDEALPGNAVSEERAWLLLYRNVGTCEQACLERLYAIRQMRLMLGREMDRVVRIFLHGDTAPDTLFHVEEHEGLVSVQDAELSLLLANKKPEGLADGGYYLVDPHSNLVMYFPPDLEPGDIVDDIKRLLKLSRIG
jgi:hypothetical protein